MVLALEVPIEVLEILVLNLGITLAHKRDFSSHRPKKLVNTRLRMANGRQREGGRLGDPFL